MSAKPIRWMMTGAGKPFVPMEFEIGTLAPDEVLVEIAGCGVCHTDLGYYYDGVRTKHELPLTLGHEISGHVVDTGADALWYTDRAVIVPAVIPCGHCDACQRGKATICPNQKMPGNDIQGGFATHIVVPSRGLCVVDEHRLAAVGIDLADLSVIADAVTTPYQAVVQAGVTQGDLVIVNGVGGVGGYAAQIAAAMGGIVVAIDVNDEKLAAITGQGAALTLNVKADDAARHQGGDPGLRQGARSAPDRMDHFRMLRHPRRAGDGFQPAQSRRHARRRRLHHGQGRGAALEPDGLSRARDRQLGLPARALSGCLGAGAEWPRQGRRRSSRSIRSAKSIRCSRRPMPARSSAAPFSFLHREEHCHDCRSCPRHRHTEIRAEGSQSRRRRGARNRFQGRALREASGEGIDGKPVAGLFNAWITLDNPSQFNSYTTDMVKATILAFRAASAARDVVAVVFTGAGDKAFCTGGNTKEYAEYYAGNPQEYRGYMRLFNDMVSAIIGCDKPVICRVNGMRIGGGQEIGMACDFSIAQDLARFGQAGPKHGSAPIGGATDFLPYMIGCEQAMVSGLLCEPFSAHKAYRLGIISEVVPALKVDGKFVANPTVVTDRYLDEYGRIIHGEPKTGAAVAEGQALLKRGTVDLEPARREGRGAVHQAALHLPRMHDQDRRGAAQAEA